MEMGSDGVCPVDILRGCCHTFWINDQEEQLGDAETEKTWNE